ALWQLGAKWHLHDGDEVWAHAQSSTATLVRCRSGEGTWDALTPMGETFGTMDLLDLGRTHLLMTAKSTKRPGVLYAVERATGLFTEIARERLDTHQDYYSQPRGGELGGGPVVIHPPHNPRFHAPDAALPPSLLSIPTTHTRETAPRMTPSCLTMCPQSTADPRDRLRRTCRHERASSPPRASASSKSTTAVRPASAAPGATVCAGSGGSSTSRTPWPPSTDSSPPAW